MQLYSFKTPFTIVPRNTKQRIFKHQIFSEHYRLYLLEHASPKHRSGKINFIESAYIIIKVKDYYKKDY